jgi:hypothetical protein
MALSTLRRHLKKDSPREGGAKPSRLNSNKGTKCEIGHCRHFCGIQKSDGSRFVDGTFLFFEMLDCAQQFTGAGITLEGERLEDGADTILNPDRFRLQNPVIVILA